MTGRSDKECDTRSDASSTLVDAQSFLERGKAESKAASYPRLSRVPACLARRPLCALLTLALVAVVVLAVALPSALLTAQRHARGFPPAHAGCSIVQQSATLTLHFDADAPSPPYPPLINQTFGALISKDSGHDALQGSQNRSSNTRFRFQACALPFMGYTSAEAGTFGQLQVEGGRCLATAENTTNMAIFQAEPCSYDDSPQTARQWFRYADGDVRFVGQPNTTETPYNASRLFTFYSEGYTTDPDNFPNTCRLLAINQAPTHRSLRFDGLASP